MNGSLAVLVALALGLAGGLAADRLGLVRQPSGISQQQFHDNCRAENGRYGALNRQVVCTLDGDTQVVCQFDGVLGNCLWSGGIRAGTLLAILGSTVHADRLG